MLNVGVKRADYLKRGENIPVNVKAQFYVADKLVFKNIRRLLGIDKCRWLSTAAAPIAPDLIDWYWAIGKPMYEVYGLTDCTGIATANFSEDFRIGSVGKAAEGVEVVPVSYTHLTLPTSDLV